MAKGKHLRNFVLWLEGRRVRVPALAPMLEEAGYTVVRVQRGRDGLQTLQQREPGLIVVYAASLGSSGARLVRRFQEAAPLVPLLLILGQGVRASVNLTRGKILHLPLRRRTLLRAVHRLFPLPHQEAQWQDYGVFRFDPVHRRIWRDGREWELTPKTARLLAYFLQNPNRVIPREELFEAVWNMPSNNDLRTLEVHICWLRKALEANPRKPTLLKTLRGRGYMLELSSKQEPA